jgi:hypothetical protein
MLEDTKNPEAFVHAALFGPDDPPDGVSPSTIPPTETDNPPPTLRNCDLTRPSEVPTQPFASEGIWVGDDDD